MSNPQSSQSPHSNQSPLLREIVDLLHIRKRFFFSAVLFSVFGIAFNLSGLQLLIPLAQGLIRNDFSHVRDGLGLIEKTERHFPSLFQDSHLAFFPLAAIVLCLIFVQNIFNYYSELLITRETKKAELKLRQNLFSRYLTFGKLFFDRNTTPDIFNTLTQQVSAVAGQVRSYHRIVTQLLSVIAIFGWLLFISWKLTLVSIFILPLYGYLSHSAIQKVRTKIKESEKSMIQIKQRLYNLITCMPLVKTSAAEEDERRIFDKESERETSAALEVDKQTLWVKPIEDFSLFITLILIAAAMSLVRSQDKSADISPYLVFFFTIQQLLTRIGVFNEFKIQKARTESAWLQIKKIFDLKDKFVVSGGRISFHTIKHQITFNNLSFGYFPNRPILKNLNFTIEAAKTTAIIGPTGAGKTTLLSLLLRLYDCPSQSILVDGRDIREIEIGSLLKKTAFVSQDILLFNESLRFNLTYGLKEPCSDSQIWTALKVASLDEFVTALPQKLNTLVGERGTRFSGGEKQRISIARAILKQADIFLLDEATSSLDTKTEKQIQTAIREITHNKTTIIVTHRLSAISNADKIIVLKHGEIVEQGALQELLSRQGEFSKQWHAHHSQDLNQTKSSYPNRLQNHSNKE